MQERYYEGEIIRDKKYQGETIEQCRFTDCEFENCVFEECKIVSCTFVNCRFYNCAIISLRAAYSEVKNSKFKTCDLIGVHWDQLRPQGRYGASIDRLENCCIKYNTFLEMSFVKFDFSGNVIQECLFEKCNLSESNFRDCRLEASQIYGCDLRKADFRGARGYAIDIASNKLKQAKFSYPDVLSLLDSLDIKID